MSRVRAQWAGVLLAVVTTLAAGCSSGSGPRDSVSDPDPGFSGARSTTQGTSHPKVSSSSNLATATPTSVPPVTRSTSAPTPSAKATVQRPRSTPTRSSAATTLPLGLRTGDAQQILTVTAPGSTSTIGALQRWTRVAGGWRRVGTAVSAHLGSAGIGAASESSTKTPQGSFTLTQAFGREADPGTALPYLRTTPDYWWISQAGALYNTRQRCVTGCRFTRGDPNEHLFYETPFYDYAVVIDYNTANSPGGVQPGRGSAFFLHVTDGNPTQGCIAVARADLISILAWLEPGKHPRILVGLT